MLWYMTPLTCVGRHILGALRVTLSTPGGARMSSALAGLSGQGSSVATTAVVAGVRVTGGTGVGRRGPVRRGMGVGWVAGSSLRGVTAVPFLPAERGRA